MTEKEIFKQRQNADLDRKIAMTKDRIRKFVDWCDDNEMDVYQSFSGGKDSCVLRHIFYSMGLGKVVTPVFSNTGLELPEIVKFTRNFEGLIEVRPKKNFKEVWDEDGMPIGSKMTSKKLRVLQEGLNGKNKNMHHLYDTGITSDGRKAPSYKLANKWRHLVNNKHGLKFTDKCCDHLKKEPLDTFQKSHGGGRFDAMMADEGGKRGDKHVCTIFDSKKPHSSPMLFWLESDVWDYIERFNVEVCEVYYSRIFNLEGECLACDSPYTNHTTVAEWESNSETSIALHVDGDNLTWSMHVDLKTKDKYWFIAGEKRTGCSFCGFGVQFEKGANRFQKLSVSNPRLHRIIMDRMDMGKAMSLINIPIKFIE